MNGRSDMPRAVTKHLSDAEALTSGQYVRCAICDRWVGPSDLHRLTVEDAVMCWRCGDVGPLSENLVGQTVFTYARLAEDGKHG
jgi:hypothetical protein